MTEPHRHIPICEREPQDRPRERLLHRGAETLTTTELLGILIQSGTPFKSALDLSEAVLESIAYNNAHLSQLNVQQLQRIPGIGPAKAAKIVAALELGRRQAQGGYARPGKVDKPRVFHSSREAALYLQPQLGYRQHEEFHVLYLAKSNCLIAHRQISTGGFSNTVADPFIIYSHALYHRASRVMLCHNHPSGHLAASSADVHMTRRLVAAGKLLNIDVLDHIIVAQGGYYSLAEEGLM